MQWILPLLAGLGIGSLLKSVVDHVIARRMATDDRLYREKREAYLGLLDALHRAAVAPSNESSKNFAVWQTRCRLFGSPDVAHYSQEMVETNENQVEREQVFQSLIEAMKTDLAR